MSDNRTFRVALLVSALVHSIFFWGMPYAPFFPSRRSLENLKITYYKIKESPKKELITRKKMEPIAEKLPDIKKEEILKPSKLAERKAEKTKAEPAHLIRKSRPEEKEFETVVKEEADDARKATYISYYRAVRERIRQFADRNYPKDRRLGEGEVFLSFIVASSGELLQIKVIDSRSIDNAQLRNIAINSIRDASPFPPFPKGMSQYQITFNVVISFEKTK